jgi:DNA repair protein RadC
MRRRALYVRDELGQFVPAGADEIVAGAKAYLRSRVRRGIPLTSPQVVRDFLTVHLAERDCEYFCLLLLDTRHRFLKFVELFRGTIDRASVHVREVVKAAIEAQAAAVVLVHNHRVR